MTIEEIIHHEKFIIHDIQFLIDKGVSRCVECDKSAIEYHQEIINYLETLQALENEIERVIKLDKKQVQNNKVLKEINPEKRHVLAYCVKVLEGLRELWLNTQNQL